MILIKNGRVIDPAKGTDDVMDMVIDGGKIKAMGHYPENGEYETVIDASGLTVWPSWAAFRKCGPLMTVYVLASSAGSIRKHWPESAICFRSKLVRVFWIMDPPWMRFYDHGILGGHRGSADGRCLTFCIWYYFTTGRLPGEAFFL